MERQERPKPLIIAAFRGKMLLHGMQAVRGFGPLFVNSCKDPGPVSHALSNGLRRGPRNENSAGV